jgi:hypothetical protein
VAMAYSFYLVRVVQRPFVVRIIFYKQVKK